MGAYNHILGTGLVFSMFSTKPAQQRISFCDQETKYPNTRPPHELCCLVLTGTV